MALFKTGADIEVQSEGGMTTLMVAAGHCQNPAAKPVRTARRKAVKGRQPLIARREIQS
jgi:hypothetical protein